MNWKIIVLSLFLIATVTIRVAIYPGSAMTHPSLLQEAEHELALKPSAYQHPTNTDRLRNWNHRSNCEQSRLVDRISLERRSIETET